MKRFLEIGEAFLSGWEKYCVLLANIVSLKETRVELEGYDTWYQELKKEEIRFQGVKK